MDYYAIVHNDFDGTASASVYARSIGYLPRKVFFTEPTQLPQLLNTLIIEDGIKKVVIADLGMNQNGLQEAISGIKKIKRFNVEIEWYDHHVWKEEWKTAISNAGVKLIVDTSTCAAGVVFKYAGKRDDEVSKKLVSADCSVDIWLHNDPMGEKLRRIVENNRDYSWKEYLIKKFFNGVIWDEEFENILEDIVDKELKGYSKLSKYVKVYEVDGVKVAIAIRWKGPPDISYAAQYIMARTGANVFVSANGKSISFRSDRYDVRQFALKLGGGGHPLAAGASLRIPLIYRMLKRIGIIGPSLNWVSNKVIPIIQEVKFKQVEVGKT